MNRNEIIRMALEAGINHATSEFYGNELERLARMVAAAEREACAKICETEWETFQEQQYGYTVASIIRSRNESTT